MSTPFQSWDEVREALEGGATIKVDGIWTFKGKHSHCTHADCCDDYHESSKDAVDTMKRRGELEEVKRV